MAGVVPKKSTSGRKQWTVHDGSSYLKRLRSQLADEGCPESQVILAKQLLDDSETDSLVDAKENAKLGIYWLIKASEQGNIEATDLLKTCIETGKGISEHNYLDVKSCISMTQDEKIARKAARKIFASLSNGSDYITCEQLQRRILSIDKKSSVSSLKSRETVENGGVANNELAKGYEDSSDSEDEADWSERLSSSSSNEKLTEENLVFAAVDYSHGLLPIEDKMLCLSQPNLRALDNIYYIHRSLLHPWFVLRIFYYKIVRYLAQSFNLLVAFGRTDFHLLLMIFIYSCFNSQSAILFVPIMVYYGTFLIMCIATFQMLCGQHNFSDFRMWSGLFICYSGGGLSAEKAEEQYIKNNLKPYGHFFLALLVNLATYSLISKQWIPESELTVISFCLMFTTLLGFKTNFRGKPTFDVLVFFSFALNVLARYPYETDPVVTQGWRFLEFKIPTYASYIIGNGIEFCINFRTGLYVLVFTVLFRLAWRENWRGTYRILIPHCVTLTWLQVCIISAQGATMYGLVRGTLCLVGLVCFLPLVGITSILLPAAALAKWFVTSNLFYAISFFVALSLLGLFVSWFLAQTRLRAYIAAIQLFLLVGAILTFFNVLHPDKFEVFMSNDVPKYLPWEVFQRHCHQPMWQEENIAKSQISCAELENALIHWDGYINSIKIKSITNSAKSIVNKFPKFISDILTCYYGDVVNENSCENLEEKYQEHCQLLYDSLRSANMCSLQKYNTYTFEVVIRMHSGIWGKSPELSLILPNFFKNFTLKLKPGDHIWFQGELFNNENAGADGVLGGFNPHVNILGVGCLNCQNNLTELTLTNESLFNSITNYLTLGLKFLFNVLFYPIFV